MSYGKPFSREQALTFRICRKSRDPDRHGQGWAKDQDSKNSINQSWALALGIPEDSLRLPTQGEDEQRTKSENEHRSFWEIISSIFHEDLLTRLGSDKIIFFQIVQSRKRPNASMFGFGFGWGHCQHDTRPVDKISKSRHRIPSLLVWQYSAGVRWCVAFGYPFSAGKIKVEVEYAMSSRQRKTKATLNLKYTEIEAWFSVRQEIDCGTRDVVGNAILTGAGLNIQDQPEIERSRSNDHIVTFSIRRRTRICTTALTSLRALGKLEDCLCRQKTSDKQRYSRARHLERAPVDISPHF